MDFSWHDEDSIIQQHCFLPFICDIFFLFYFHSTQLGTHACQKKKVAFSPSSTPSFDFHYSQNEIVHNSTDSERESKSKKGLWVTEKCQFTKCRWQSVIESLGGISIQFHKKWQDLGFHSACAYGASFTYIHKFEWGGRCGGNQEEATSIDLKMTADTVRRFQEFSTNLCKNCQLA